MDSDTFWAKWYDDGSSYPLQAHLLDTAAFAVVLCDEWLPQHVLERAADLSGVTAGQVRDVVVRAAGLHDLGKATPQFQTQMFSRSAFAGSEVVDARLRGAGLPLDGLACDGLRVPSGADGRLRRHEVASGVMLSTDDQSQSPLAAGLGAGLLVAGHHGRWQLDAEDLGPQSFPDRKWWEQLRHDDGPWQRAWRHIRNTVVDVAGLGDDMRIDPRVVPVLTGLVVLADWLASAVADERAAAGVTSPLGGSWPQHYSRTSAEAASRVEALLGRAVVPDSGFDSAFGFGPNAIQTELLTASGPGLRIVSVPTGAGKSEAALGRWMSSSRGAGLFFGLPTMATADAMFTRVRDMFASTATDAFGAVAHSRSTLNEFYRPADDAAAVSSPSSTMHGAEPDEPDPAGLRPSEWLVGSRRAVLAPVTVGTADQLLLSVVRHRFNVLRLLGAVTKTVVLDEVHGYDAHMAAVLERFLEWAGLWHVDVVLLSASLPTERRHAYAAAYRAGAQSTRPAPPGADAAPAPYPSITTVTPTAVEPDVVPVRHDAPRTVRLSFVVTDSVTQSAVDRVRALRRDHPDAKIGVIVNTVGRCQQIAEDLLGRGQGPPVGCEMTVMHSRFTADRRAADVAAAVQQFGKRSVSGPSVLVATQVVEQSVDLDFDVLVVELCPAPSLVQRIGRVQRHDLGVPGRQRRRPTGLPEPTVHVLVPSVVEDPDPGAWALLPYTTAEIIATWRRALDHGRVERVSVPDDVQRFVDDAHVTADVVFASVDGQVADVPGGVAHVVGVTGDRAQAAVRMVPGPSQFVLGPIVAPRPEPLLNLWGSADDPPTVRLVDQRGATVIFQCTDDASECARRVCPARHGVLPVAPTKEEVQELLGWTVPAGLGTDRLLARGGSLPSWAVTGRQFARGPLADVVVLDACDPDVPVVYDADLGAIRRVAS